MKCHRCHKDFADEETRCPHCGGANASAAGVFQTSTVLICSGGAEHVYRSVEEVPVRLRTRLEKSTNSANSATILIADRRGRSEIARAFRGLPEAAQRRLMRAIAGSPAGANRLTPRRRKALLALLLMLVVTLIALVFRVRWP